MPLHPATSVNEWRFRPRGAGRFVGAGFLAFWLCGWVMGEAFALGLILMGLWSLVTGVPPMGAKEPLPLGGSLAGGAFLLVWVTFWTLGGIMAIRELLRMLWAEDHLLLGPAQLTLTRTLGPFRKTRSLSRRDIQRVYLQPPSDALAVQTGNETLELTSLGLPAERATAAEALCQELGIPAAVAVPADLPKGWVELLTAHGEAVLVANPRTRRKQAGFVTGLAIVVWTGIALLARESLRDPNLWGLTAMATVLGTWLAWGANRLRRSRLEWRLERAAIFKQRRTGSLTKPLAEARALELTESTDSDGDRSYVLSAIEPAGKQRHITIDRAMHDPSVPRQLGQWLADRTGIPFADKVPTAASRQADLQKLREQLASAGKLGKLLAGLIDRAQRRP